MIPKQLLNSSKTTFKKSTKRVFWPWKWSKWYSQGPKIARKFRFLRSYINISSWKYTKNWGFKIKNYPETTSERLENHFQKVQKTGFLTLKMVKMKLSKDQNLTVNFDFRGHIATFGAENTPLIEPFKGREQCPNNFWKTPNQLSKSQKKRFFWPKKWSNHGYKFWKMAKISTKKLDFGGHQIIFLVNDTRKYWLSKFKNNAQTTLKQLRNKFGESQNLTKKYAPPPTTHHSRLF